jgi:hypothetical protein
MRLSRFSSQWAASKTIAPRTDHTLEAGRKWDGHVILLEIHPQLASEKHVLKNMLQILTDMRKPKLRPLVSKPSGALPVSSARLKSASGAQGTPPNSSAKSGTLADAERLLAGLAVKVLREIKAQRR